MATHSDFASEIPAVLAHFGLMLTGGAQAVAGGTLNWNFRVGTSRGTRFLRRYRDDLETERIAGEHALVLWVGERGVPAPAPITSTVGQTIISQGQSRWAIFPWAPGRQLPRGSLSSARARALGEMHGRIQAVLATHPASAGATMQMTWDKDQSAMYLSRIMDTARERQAEDWIQAGLARQARMLDEMDVLPPEAFAALPVQLLHGDFHDQQVLFDGDLVSAAVDWEIWHADPRAWELVRSLAFSEVLATEQQEDYLAGYREHVQLSADECRLGLRLWWQSRVVGLWVWAAYFLHGNERVKDFFPSMIGELERIADGAWRTQVEERFIRAAIG